VVAAAGRWSWWNQYGSVPLDVCVRRAKEGRLAGVIVKQGYPDVRRAFVDAGIPWATERYVYPNNPQNEAERLAGDIAAGARFAVINAEVEWQSRSGSLMDSLLRRFRELQPTAELYACTDTRGARMELPYQRELAHVVTGWMPMVYPLSFYPGRGRDFVERAFRDCLDGKDFRGKPVLPALQTYGDIGADAVAAQVEEVRRRRLPGCQAYTVCHATDREWAAFVAGNEHEEEVDMERLEEVERRVAFALTAIQVTRGEVDSVEALIALHDGQLAFLRTALQVVAGRQPEGQAAADWAERIERLEAMERELRAQHERAMAAAAAIAEELKRLAEASAAPRG
jgi:hypothetical protein